jgi:hypothetical protein
LIVFVGDQALKDRTHLLYLGTCLSQVLLTTHFLLSCGCCMSEQFYMAKVLGLSAVGIVGGHTQILRQVHHMDDVRVLLLFPRQRTQLLRIVLIRRKLIFDMVL